MAPKPIHQLRGVDSNRAVQLDYDRCNGCNECVGVCARAAVSAFQRADERYPPLVVPRDSNNERNTHTSRVRLDDSFCVGCGECVKVCEPKCLEPSVNLQRLRKLAGPGTINMAVVSPAFVEAVSANFGFNTEKQIIFLLKKLLFTHVFTVAPL